MTALSDLMAARFLSILCFFAAMAVPSFAQFNISVEQNGQASSVANGAQLTLNAPAAGQSVAANFTLTYLGPTRANFSAPPQILGSGNFTVEGFTAPASLPSLGSATFTIRFTAKDSSQAVGQFTWPFSLDAPLGGVSPGGGVITFNLVGATPRFVVSALQADNNYLTVPNGGAIPFADTVVNSASTITISISNPGSGPGTVNSIAVSGDGFQLKGVPFLPLTLNAGAEVRVTAQFIPATVGPQKGSLQISFASGPYSAAIAGNGIASFFTYQITRDNKTSPLPPNQAITLDDTKVGEKTSVVIQFQSIASTPVVLTLLTSSGPPFTLSDVPFLPLTMQPRDTNSVTITYAPVQPGQSSGRLQIGNETFTLSARGLGPLFQYSYQVNNVSVPVNPQDTISFTPLAVGQTGSLQFTIANNGTTSGSVVSIGVLDTKGIFRLRNLPAFPAQIDPNGTSGFAIDFAPAAAGQVNTTLFINNQTFTLSGFSSAPPALPGYHFSGASGVQPPFQQPAIGLSLDAAYPIALSGTLNLTMTPDNFVADPAVQFSSGGRQVAFTIPPNTLQAVFPNGSKQIQLQTGTVAGAILIQPAFAIGSGSDITPANPATLQLTVQALAPTLLTAHVGTTSASGFSIVVTGFSTTRFLDHMDFQLTGSPGFALNLNRVTVDLSGAARVWSLSAASQTFGGQFNVEIPFNLATGATTGAAVDLSKSISSISVIAANEIGVSNSLQVVNP